MRSPANMMAAVQQCPAAAVLWDLKECLDFSGARWTAVFDRIGGCELLTEVGGRTSSTRIASPEQQQPVLPFLGSALFRVPVPSPDHVPDSSPHPHVLKGHT